LRIAPEPAVVDPGGRVVGRHSQLIIDAGGPSGQPVAICSLGDRT